MPTFEQSRSHNIAFLLDERLLRACTEFITENSTARSSVVTADDPKLRFSLKLGETQRLDCDSVEEIVRLANSGDNTIRALLISTGLFFEPSVTVNFRISEYGNTVSYTIRGDDQQKVFYLVNQLEDFVARTRCWYTRLAFLDAVTAILGLIAVLFIAGTLGLGIYAAFGMDASSGTSTSSSSRSSAIVSGATVAGVLLLFALGAGINRLRKWLFPSGIFALGDGIGTAERLRFWRSLIGGSIILAAAINIATSFIP